MSSRILPRNLKKTDKQPSELQLCYLLRMGTQQGAFFTKLNKDKGLSY
jgi:hypothetical protein